MLISRQWLQKFFNTDLPSAEKLAEAITFHAFEIDGTQKHGDPSKAETSDDIFDVKVTPNRGHDALSHRGIAREVSAILKVPFSKDPFAQKPSLSPVTEAVAVTLEDPALSARYIAGYIRNIKVGPSPQWLKRDLESIGQRSINNVVDATNYVMFNVGQPLHAFDADKLQKGPSLGRSAKDGPLYHIVVRKARAGEKLMALDQKEYPLADRMLVIADGNADVPVGIAGVKGGEPAGITEATKDIIIESANFDGVSVRKTAQALKLRTDASARFEQVLSPELAGYGMQAVVALIVEIAGGELVGFADVYPAPMPTAHVSVSTQKVNEILGTTLTGAEVADAFSRLGFAYKEENGVFDVQPPFERLDILISEDLVEEVARIVGYDKVPSVELPPASSAPEVNAHFYAAEQAREELVAKGYSEVFTSVFAEGGERAVLNKVDSVRPYLRESLLQGLTEALAKNKNNKDILGLAEVKLFEIGTVWKGGQELMMVGTITEKEKATEKPLEAIAAEKYEDLSVSPTERYKTFSKYPYIVRDIALWTPASTNTQEVPAVIKTEAGELAVAISLFDRFEKEGKVSLAFRIIFQSFERTLTEVEVNEVMEKISSALKSKGFEIR